MSAKKREAWVVCASTADWDAPLWTNKQHLMSRLAERGLPVLYIDSPGLRSASLASSRDLRRMALRMLNWSPVAREVGKGIWRDSPLVVPMHGREVVERINGHLQRARLRRNVRALGVEGHVLWVYAPTALGLADVGTCRALIYHCVDDLTAFPAIGRNVGLAEAELVRRADVCIASSLPLAERLSVMGAQEVLYWPNCADTTRFAMAKPVNLPASARPVAGFAGAVQEHKLDIELLTELAGRLPGWDFQLVGPVGEGLRSSVIDQATLPPNVQLVGARTREELPTTVASFDVAMIPYRMNEYTRGVFPMKVFEYLAAGVPVVSTPLPSLVGEVEYVVFAKGSDAWVDALEEARAKRRNPAAIEERKEYAKGHSWEQRTDEALAVLARWVPRLMADNTQTSSP